MYFVRDAFLEAGCRAGVTNENWFPPPLAGLGHEADKACEKRRVHSSPSGARTARPDLGLVRDPSPQGTINGARDLSTNPGSLRDPSPQGEAETITTATAAPSFVIGIGNPDRGDDGVGRLVAQQLRNNLPPDVRIEEQDGGAAALIERLRDVDSVWLIDAAVSGAPAGTIRCTDCNATDALPARPGASSHGLGVAEAVALARTLHGLPRVCLLYTVEGVTFAPGAPMSSAVTEAADALVALVVQQLRSA